MFAFDMSAEIKSVFNFSSLAFSLVHTGYGQICNCTSLNRKLIHPRSYCDFTSHLFSFFFLVQFCYPTFMNTQLFKQTCLLFLFWHGDYCEGSISHILLWIILNKGVEVCSYLALFAVNLLFELRAEGSSCITENVNLRFPNFYYLPWKISSLNHSFIRSGLLLCSMSYRALLCFADFGNEWTHCRVSRCWTDCCISIRSDWDTMESRLAFITWHAHYWPLKRMTATACAMWLCLTC